MGSICSFDKSCLDDLNSLMKAGSNRVPKGTGKTVIRNGKKVDAAGTFASKEGGAPETENMKHSGPHGSGDGDGKKTKADEGVVSTTEGVMPSKEFDKLKETAAADKQQEEEMFGGDLPWNDTEEDRIADLEEELSSGRLIDMEGIPPMPPPPVPGAKKERSAPWQGPSYPEPTGSWGSDMDADAIADEVLGGGPTKPKESPKDDLATLTGGAPSEPSFDPDSTVAGGSSSEVGYDPDSAAPIGGYDDPTDVDDYEPSPIGDAGTKEFADTPAYDSSKLNVKEREGSAFLSDDEEFVGYLGAPSKKEELKTDASAKKDDLSSLMADDSPMSEYPASSKLAIQAMKDKVKQDRAAAQPVKEESPADKFNKEQKYGRVYDQAKRAGKDHKEASAIASSASGMETPAPGTWQSPEQKKAIEKYKKEAAAKQKASAAERQAAEEASQAEAAAYKQDITTSDPDAEQQFAQQARENKVKQDQQQAAMQAKQAKRASGKDKDILEALDIAGGGEAAPMGMPSFGPAAPRPGMSGKQLASNEAAFGKQVSKLQASGQKQLEAQRAAAQKKAASEQTAKDKLYASREKEFAADPAAEKKFEMQRQRNLDKLATRQGKRDVKMDKLRESDVGQDLAAASSMPVSGQQAQQTSQEQGGLDGLFDLTDDTSVSGAELEKPVGQMPSTANIQKEQAAPEIGIGQQQATTMKKPKSDKAGFKQAQKDLAEQGVLTNEKKDAIALEAQKKADAEQKAKDQAYAKMDAFQAGKGSKAPRGLPFSQMYGAGAGIGSSMTQDSGVAGQTGAFVAQRAHQLLNPDLRPHTAPTFAGTGRGARTRDSHSKGTTAATAPGQGIPAQKSVEGLLGL